jgi:LysM domain
MRIATIVTAAALLAGPAFAQAPEPTPEQDTSETEGKPAQEPGEVRTTPAKPGAKDQSAGTTHTVVRGDTLWDLSQTYLGSPWYWPKVWSYNPQIANPHWIYPGNLVRFFPGTGEEPAGQVEIEIEPGSGTAGEGDIEAVEPVEEERVLMLGPRPYQPRGREVVPRVGFVTEEEVARTGTLSKSSAETEMLSTGNIVYLQFRDRSQAVVGKDFTIFRTDRKVYHPRSGKFLGYMTLLLGQARILPGSSQDYVRAQLTFAYDSMYRGDLVGQAGEPRHFTVSLVANTNTQDLEGAVVASMDPYITVNGERDEIVVDLGAAEGVQRGNSFTIIRQADPNDQGVDPAANQDPKLPIEDLGLCVAVEVKQHTTTCVLLRTVREIVAGDRMVLRAPAKAPVSAR